MSSSWYKREVTVTHHGWDYIPDRQEPFKDITSILVIHWLLDFILFYFILVTNITFYGLIQHPPSMSNGSTVHESSPQMSLSACLLHFACDLLDRRVSELFVVVLLPSAATKVFCWRDESRYTDRADTAIFQMAEGDVCAHTLQYTHIKAHTDMYISTHTQTEEGAEGGGGEVAG